MFVKQKYKEFIKMIPKGVTLVAVSKTKPIADIREAYEAGHRVFGENKVQEMVNKYDALPKDISWHMIGHLQRNKVKYMAHFVDLIHGVDSMKTLQEIDRQAKRNNRVISCLLQARIAKEETKFGMGFDEIRNILYSKELKELEHVKVLGLMGMASFTDDMEVVGREFSSLHALYQELRAEGLDLDILSMGMSGDFETAIANGSNMIRVGSAIFGERNYLA